VLTPNLDEAAVFSGRAVSGRDQIPDAARALLDLGPEWVLIKGGHLPRERPADFLAGPDTALWLEAVARLPHRPRGTGCALASALAGGLARGATVPEAARTAKRIVTEAIARQFSLGKGRFLDPAGWPSS
jgi:hydroxymethylpyrimidine/phosphomethylpyrimidine kinase